jgi:DnaJ-class molecular chaperone
MSSSTPASSVKETLYYDRLEVKPTASAEEIKRAFRKRALEVHPDRGGDANKFKEVNEAYSTLSDPQKRAQYDRYGSGWQQQAEENRVENHGRGDVRTVVRVYPHQVAHDTEITVRYTRRDFCRPCNGMGAMGAVMATCRACRGQGMTLGMMGFGMPMPAMCTACKGQKCMPDTLGKPACRACDASRGYNQRQNQVTVRVLAGTPNGYNYRVSGEGDEYELGVRGDLRVVVSFIRIPLTCILRGNDIVMVRTISLAQAIGLRPIRLRSLLSSATENRDITFTTKQTLNTGAIIKIPRGGIECHYEFTNDGEPVRLDHPVIGDCAIHFRVRLPDAQKIKDLPEGQHMSALAALDWHLKDGDWDSDEEEEHLTPGMVPKTVAVDAADKGALDFSTLEYRAAKNDDPTAHHYEDVDEGQDDEQSAHPGGAQGQSCRVQ